MNTKGLLQVFGRLWLMEESQASYWADVAQQILVSKTMDALPGMDPRVRMNYREAYGTQAWEDIFRVDENGNMNPKGQVQVIRLRGPLMEDDYCGSPGMNTMQLALRAAANDSEISSIVLYNDSPGGTVAGTGNLAKEVKLADQKKPVVSFVNKMMCSADYWIGSSAREIIADNEIAGYNSYIGSIGTKAVFMDRTKEMESKGIRMISVYADKSGRKGKYSEDILSGDYTRLKSELNSINEVFHANVIENRGDKLKLDKENVLEGDVYNVKEALKYGLIDKVGSFQMAVKRSLQMAKTIKL